MSWRERWELFKFYYVIYEKVCMIVLALIIEEIKNLVSFFFKEYVLKAFFFFKGYINIAENYFNKKFSQLDEKTFNQNVLIKQNKSLTYAEVINLLNRRQKGKFYAPLLSFWPLFLTASVALFLLFMVVFLHSSKLFSYLNLLTIISIIAVGVAISFWFSIFFVEKKKGNHVSAIKRNIELGFYLFLFTEALCFIALFWVFLHSLLAASIHIGIYNPGEGIANIYINEFVKINENWNVYYFKSVGTPSYYKISSLYTLMDTELFKTKDIKLHVNFYDRGQLIDPYKLPLLNTFILLTSAACLNISHVSLRTSRFLKSFFWLFVTIFLGLFFVSIQYKEYKECSFQYNDGIYAACFFSLTGLHGIHVMIGISALIVCAINLLFQNYSPNFHQSYMYSIFYWHFVDVIWIVVYFVIYLWPASYFFIDDIFTSYKSFFTVNFSKNYLNKVICYNSFVDYKINSQMLYLYFTKTLNINLINFDAMESKVANENYNVRKVYFPTWSFIKNHFNSDLKHSCINKLENFDEIIQIFVNFIKKEIFTPAIISCVRALRYENIYFISYTTTPDMSVVDAYELKKPRPFLSLNESLELSEYVSNWKNIYNSAHLFNGYDYKTVIEVFFLKAHDMNVYKNSISNDYDPYYELLRLDLIEGKNFINYNGVKKDPILYCFILTEMHKELINCVQNAYIIDFIDKYNRFFIYKALSNLGLKPLSDLWCFFFFPYIIANDASIRYRI